MLPESISNESTNDAGGVDAENGTPADPSAPVAKLLPATPWARAEVGLVVLLVVVPSVYQGFADIFWPEAAVRRPPLGWYFSYLVVHNLGLIGLVAYLLARSGEPAAAFGLGKPRWLIDAVTAIGLFVANLWLSTTVWDVVSGLNDATARDTSSLYPPPAHKGWEYVLTLAGCLTTGLGEEMVFRGLLLTRLERLLHSTVGGVVVSSGLFGLAHLSQGPAGVLSNVVFGLFVGTAFAFQRRIWAVALMHGAYIIYLSLTP